MATPRPSKPFTRGGITYPSQYAYRKAVAARAGFASPAARVKAIKQTARELQRYTEQIPTLERGALVARIADLRGTLGPFREGAALSERTSNNLPPEILNTLRRLGPNAYPLWRTLYR